MARENQGLQIALIIFVMLTIVLGVTTFLFVRRSDEADNKAKAATKQSTDDNAKATALQLENGRLREMIGFAATLSQQDIDTEWEKDKAEFGGALPDDQKHYRPIIKQLVETLNAKNAELVKRQADDQKTRDLLLAREASKDGAIKKIDDAMKKYGDDLAAVTTTFTAERKRIEADQAKAVEQFAAARKGAQEAVAAVEAKLLDVNAKLVKTSTMLVGKSKQLEEVTKEIVDIPDGEIRWVNQHAGTVWVNLGKADNLPRQTNFSVYASNATDLTKSGKKASIQITQILGDHLAEGRIIDDKVSDPIVPGDKVFSPVWNAGEIRHFAITGIVDLDGDGRSDIAALRSLIELNGGAIDSYTDDKGEKHGDLTVNTKYLVVGEVPSTTGAQQAVLSGYSKMIGEADRLGVQKLPLPELLHGMGWQNQNPVVRYGSGANPSDFRPKPAEGAPKSSGANVFQPRTPPRSGSGSGGAY